MKKIMFACVCACVLLATGCKERSKPKTSEQKLEEINKRVDEGYIVRNYKTIFSECLFDTLSKIGLRFVYNEHISTNYNRSNGELFLFGTFDSLDDKDKEVSMEAKFVVDMLNERIKTMEYLRKR